MSEKSYVPVSLTMGHLKYCDLSNYAILSFLCHRVGKEFFVPSIYYTCTHHDSY